MDINTLSEKPLLRTASNFLSSEICQKIIEYSMPLLGESKVVGQEGGNIQDISIRSSQVAATDGDVLLELQKQIFTKVSEFTGYNQDQFEKLTVHRYTIGQEFKLHQDYFIEYEDKSAQEKHEDRCNAGGNRISTVILYLNDVEAGGKTWFPWINQSITPEQGKLLQFDYGYSDWLPNIQTQHHGLPVEAGEKWIATIWIRERSLADKSTTFKRFVEETNVFKKIVDVDYQLEVGPDWDRKLLDMSLPANDSPENAIIVAYTGGMDSNLLLYLLSALNTHQVIPYQIVPVMVKNPEAGANEDEKRAWLILNWIRAELNTNKIRNLQVITSDLKTVRDSIHEVMTNCMEKIPNYSHYNSVAVFSGVNKLPSDEGEPWQKFNWERKKPNKPYWKTPFFDLEKYHLLDAIMQLELDPMFILMGKCGNRHKTLDEQCLYFACNERRWAFRKLGINSLGNKYLTYRS